MTTAFQNNAFQTSAFQIDAVSGVIYAIDQNDTASLSGSVSGAVEVYGSISATDQNDVATILGTITSSFVPDTHDGFTKEEIVLRNSGNYQPSVRELEKYGYTQEQWDNNELVDDGWGGKINIEEFVITDTKTNINQFYIYIKYSISSLNVLDELSFVVTK